MEADETWPHDEVNARVYRDPGVYQTYSTRTALTRAERSVLLHFHRAWVGLDVLDVGVGAGRTTAWLAPYCGRYEAIDFSPVMVRAMHQRRPQISVHLADMRDMSMFGDASFDFVFAPDNVLDAAAQRGRERTLRECCRLLRPGGLLVASSHNLDWIEAGMPPRLEWSHAPLTQLRLLASYARCWRNYLHLRPRCGQRDDHAVFTDIGHDYALLHYYINRTTQRAQLSAAGFELRAVLDRTGAEVSDDSDTGHDPHLMYVAMKLTPGAPDQSEAGVDQSA